jgi:hypothetical protein
MKLADSPSAALAYTIASLERTDNRPARRFAVGTLWQGPAALFFAPPTRSSEVSAVVWSPAGEWLAFDGIAGFTLVDRETGKQRRIGPSLEYIRVVSDDGRHLGTDASYGAPTVFHVWSIPEGNLEHTLTWEGTSNAAPCGDRLLAWQAEGASAPGTRSFHLRLVPLDSTPLQVLGRWEPRGLTSFACDPSATTIFSLQEGQLLHQRLDTLSAPSRLIGGLAGKAGQVRAKAWRNRVVTADAGGEVRIWTVPAAHLERTLRSPMDVRWIALDLPERLLATAPATAATARSISLFDLAAPPTAQPARLRSDGLERLEHMKFSRPHGS